MLKKVVWALALSIGACSPLLATHNANRYFPFLEYPRASRDHIKRGRFMPTAYFAFSSAASDNGGNRIGIPEIFGRYNLQDVIDSEKDVTTKIDGGSYTNPFLVDDPSGGAKFVDKKIMFNLGGKVCNQGVIFNYEHKLSSKWYAGLWLSLMEVSSAHDFFLNEEDSVLGFKPLQEADTLQIDRVRRSVHKSIGLDGGDFSEGGIGDVDVSLTRYAHWERVLYLRSISLNTRFGALLPFSKKREINHAASLPFMSNGHIGWYLDVLPELELKQDWHLGCEIGMQYQFSQTRRERMPVGSEPFMYSSLVGKLYCHPGITLKLAPYFILKNLTDGLHVGLHLTRISHQRDTLIDERSRDERAKLPSHLDTLIHRSKWKMVEGRFDVIYDSSDAMKSWPLKPTLRASYEFPWEWFGLRNAMKVHRFVFSVDVHF